MINLAKVHIYGIFVLERILPYFRGDPNFVKQKYDHNTVHVQLTVRGRKGLLEWNNTKVAMLKNLN